MKNFTFNQRKRAVEMLMLERTQGIEKVIRAFHCCLRTLWYWWVAYQKSGDEGLTDKSCKPLSPHPKQHKPYEHDKIVCLLNLYPKISYIELLTLLQQDIEYQRTYPTLYSYCRRHNLRGEEKHKKENLHTGKYHRAIMLGFKWQMDVKYVPTNCYYGNEEVRYYQFTIIDEATQQRFIYPYKEKSTYSCKDFINRAIEFFGYIPLKIQTDNGTEFTNRLIAKKDESLQNLVDTFLEELHVTHKLIKVATPQHNCYVERSHGKDERNFYSVLKFDNYDTLVSATENWLIRYNRTLTMSFGRKNLKSPNTRRIELEQELNRFWFKDLKAIKDIPLQQKIYYYAEYHRQKQIKENAPSYTILQIHEKIQIPKFISKRISKII